MAPLLFQYIYTFSDIQCKKENCKLNKTAQKLKLKALKLAERQASLEYKLKWRRSKNRNLQAALKASDELKFNHKKLCQGAGAFVDDKLQKSIQVKKICQPFKVKESLHSSVETIKQFCQSTEAKENTHSTAISENKSCQHNKVEKKDKSTEVKEKLRTPTEAQNENFPSTTVRKNHLFEHSRTKDETRNKVLPAPIASNNFYEPIEMKKKMRSPTGAEKKKSHPTIVKKNNIFQYSRRNDESRKKLLAGPIASNNFYQPIEVKKKLHPATGAQKKHLHPTTTRKNHLFLKPQIKDETRKIILPAPIPLNNLYQPTEVKTQLHPSTEAQKKKLPRITIGKNRLFQHSRRKNILPQHTKVKKIRPTERMKNKLYLRTKPKENMYLDIPTGTTTGAERKMHNLGNSQAIGKLHRTTEIKDKWQQPAYVGENVFKQQPQGQTKSDSTSAISSLSSNRHQEQINTIRNNSFKDYASEKTNKFLKKYFCTPESCPAKRSSNIFNKLICTPGSCPAKKRGNFFHKLVCMPKSSTAKKSSNFFDKLMCTPKSCSAKKSANLINKLICTPNSCSAKKNGGFFSKLMCTSNSCIVKKSGNFFNKLMYTARSGAANGNSKFSNKIMCTPSSCSVKKSGNFLNKLVCTPSSCSVKKSGNFFNKLMFTPSSCSVKKSDNFFNKLVCTSDSCSAKKYRNFFNKLLCTPGTCSAKKSDNFNKLMCNPIPDMKWPYFGSNRYLGNCSPLLAPPMKIPTYPSMFPIHSEDVYRNPLTNCIKTSLMILFSCFVWSPCLILLLLLKCLCCSRYD